MKAKELTLKQIQEACEENDCPTCFINCEDIELAAPPSEWNLEVETKPIN